MSQYTCGVQRTTIGRWFSPSIMWVERLNSGHQGRWQAPLSTEPSCRRSLFMGTIIPSQGVLSNYFLMPILQYCHMGCEFLGNSFSL